MIATIAANLVVKLANVVGWTQSPHPLLQGAVASCCDDAEFAVLRGANGAWQQGLVVSFEVRHVQVCKGHYYVLGCFNNFRVMIIKIDLDVWVSSIAVLMVMHIAPLQRSSVGTPTVFAA